MGFDGFWILKDIYDGICFFKVFEDDLYIFIYLWVDYDSVLFMFIKYMLKDRGLVVLIVSGVMFFFVSWIW